MPRKAKDLSALDVKRLTSKGNHAVGGVTGLYLYVKDTGARSWVLRYQAAGKRRHLGLGGYPDVTLAMARTSAREAGNQIREGTDPLTAKANRITFAKAMDKYCDAKRADLGSEKNAKGWRAGLTKYALPKLGGMYVVQITVQDVLAVLSPIWATKHQTASKQRQRIEQILAWATVHGFRIDDNPARLKGNLDAILPKPSTVAEVTHRPAVAVDEVADFYDRLRRLNGNEARVLEMITLTAARSGEVRGATWSEINLSKRLWTIPAARMKAKRNHVVTLSTQAVQLLMAQPRDVDLIFPNLSGGQLTDRAVSNRMKDIYTERLFADPQSGKPAVPHGLRSTFRNWKSERTDYPREMAKFALAHAVGDQVERAYLRTTQVEKRRDMMQAWGQWLCTI